MRTVYSRELYLMSLDKSSQIVYRISEYRRRPPEGVFMQDVDLSAMLKTIVNIEVGKNDNRCGA